ncbi:myeloid cell nuclear differentiation antigen [Carlito syrichta]|uniref:Myeloid cell nuclear differentiation antigen n=1 Tax=Carlito syrichta TaxID=1868482 RepID=A0A1U7TY11_CARSF|nr:myeloid cell nuclear differentiation antigen [Carlito syrichta]
MVSEYKRIVLLKGLEQLSDHHFIIVKSLLADDLNLNKKTQDKYTRVMVCNLLEKKFKGAACVNKLIELFKYMELHDLVNNLRKEKSKVARKIKRTTLAKKRNQEGVGPAAHVPTTSHTLTSEGGEKTSVVQKRKSITKEKTKAKSNKTSQEKSQPPCPSEASTSATMGHPPPVQIPLSTPSNTSQISSTRPSNASLTQNQKAPAKCQGTSRRSVLQKDPMIVMVLKAAEPFKYECPEKGKNMMFHATVASESQFFQVKVFNTKLKEKFIKKKAIAISNYFECKGILEINKASSVSEVGLDQKIEVPSSIIKRANATPKIIHLHKQASGTIVYGLFTLQKKIVNKKNTIYEIQDNTGKMDVVGNGKWHNLKCQEGDKLRLFCFQLRTVDYKLKLMCGIHSFMKVIKAQKRKKGPVNSI